MPATAARSATSTASTRQNRSRTCASSRRGIVTLRCQAARAIAADMKISFTNSKRPYVVVKRSENWPMRRSAFAAPDTVRVIAAHSERRDIRVTASLAPRPMSRREMATAISTPSHTADAAIWRYSDVTARWWLAAPAAWPVWACVPIPYAMGTSAHAHPVGLRASVTARDVTSAAATLSAYVLPRSMSAMKRHNWVPNSASDGLTRAMSE